MTYTAVKSGAFLLVLALVLHVHRCGALLEMPRDKYDVNIGISICESNALLHNLLNIVKTAYWTLDHHYSITFHVLVDKKTAGIVAEAAKSSILIELS